LNISAFQNSTSRETRPAWADFKTAEEGRAKYVIFMVKAILQKLYFMLYKKLF
jgi:hypothetical protein